MGLHVPFVSTPQRWISVVVMNLETCDPSAHPEWTTAILLRVLGDSSSRREDRERLCWWYKCSEVTGVEAGCVCVLDPGRPPSCCPVEADEAQPASRRAFTCLSHALVKTRTLPVPRPLNLLISEVISLVNSYLGVRLRLRRCCLFLPAYIVGSELMDKS